MAYREFKPYVSAAKRRAKAALAVARLAKKGQTLSPVVIEGRIIAHTFWGKAWCDNLESYSDFENRLPRGRTYARNGSIVDLQIARGQVSALVSGSEMYRVKVKVTSVAAPHWDSLCRDCAGGIDSLVELLQGRFSRGVMERICRQSSGLFPTSEEITFTCSCPDWAEMCKHVAAVLYGIGARLDEVPELLFQLRAVDEKDLLATTGADLPLSNRVPSAARLLPTDGLAELFGLDMSSPSTSPATKPARPKQPATPRRGR